jgi:hypothetical protein
LISIGYKRVALVSKGIGRAGIVGSGKNVK